MASHVGTWTGRDGKVYLGSVGGALGAVKRITQWTASMKSASTSEWGDSDSSGFTNRAPGRRDCTFTADGKYDVATDQWSVLTPGSFYAVDLYLNYTTDPAVKWSFASALCMEFNLTVNIDTEEVIGWTSSWGADGTFTLSGVSFA